MDQVEPPPPCCGSAKAHADAFLTAMALLSEGDRLAWGVALGGGRYVPNTHTASGWFTWAIPDRPDLPLLHIHERDVVALDDSPERPGKPPPRPVN